jgi:dihydroorotate dehydrogenase
MRLLYLFDPEWIHQTIVALLRALHAASPALVRWISGASTASTGPGRIVFGIQFRTPLGLAAGFDKNAELLAALPDLGFGFSEVGTVTPRPQPGNPRPRLFRDVGAQSLFNRMGFNNDGATRVAERVRHARAKLPPGFVVGVNLGKNKDTPEENAASDYEAAAREFEGLADYLVLNVSSPNTPGLRGLQDSDKLRPIESGIV